MLISPRPPATPAEALRESYLDLLMKCLTMWIWEAGDGEQPQPFGSDWKTRTKTALKDLLRGEKRQEMDQRTKRLLGRDWPRLAHTMIGWKRLESLRLCTEDVLQRDVPGDLIETGVWRGGATILMRGVLKAYDDRSRTVWVADSFAGLPPPDPAKYPVDAGSIHHTVQSLAVSLEEVKSNFERYGLLDSQVRFLKGWFKDTLPSAPIQTLSVVRLDGDMYESTTDAISVLYPKLSVGGYLIVDDYGSVDACKAAIEDYRKANCISETIHQIDNDGVLWRRTK